MNKIILLSALFGFSGFLCAQNFEVFSEIKMENKLIGSPVFVLEENKTTIVSVNELYKLSVNVSSKTESQVLLEFTYSGDGYETTSQVLSDLNKENTFRYGEQSFKFIVNKVGS